MGSFFCAETYAVYSLAAEMGEESEKHKNIFLPETREKIQETVNMLLLGWERSALIERLLDEDLSEDSFRKEWK